MGDLHLEEIEAVEIGADDASADEYEQDAVGQDAGGDGGGGESGEKGGGCDGGEDSGRLLARSGCVVGVGLRGVCGVRRGKDRGVGWLVGHDNGWVSAASSSWTRVAGVASRNATLRLVVAE